MPNKIYNSNLKIICMIYIYIHLYNEYKESYMKKYDAGYSTYIPTNYTNNKW